MEPERPSEPDEPRAATSGLPEHLAARVEDIVRAAEEEATAVQRDLESQRRSAETEARRYLSDARRQADAMAQQRAQRLRELTDELVERAEATRRQLDALLSALERATRTIESGGLDVGPAGPSQVKPAVARAAARARPGTAGSSAAPGTASGDAGSDPQRADKPAPATFRPPPAPAGLAGGRGPRPGGRLDPAQPATEELNDGGAAETRERDLSAARLVAIEMAVAGRSREEVDRHLREAFRVQDTRGLLDDVFGVAGQPTSWSS